MVPAHPLTRGVALAVVLPGLLGLGACSDGDDGDLQAFCAAVAALEENDPFAELDIASPEEMRTAFDQLSEGARRISDAAPDDARRQSEAYVESIDELVDQLRGAGFDPRNVDALAYRQAVADYESAAVSVENAAGSLCP